MHKKLSSVPAEVPRPYEAAIAAALDDLARAQGEVAESREQLERARARVGGLVQAVQNLLPLIPEGRRGHYSEELDRIIAIERTVSRSGPVFDNVISLFRRSSQRAWTVSEVHRELANEGVSTDPKAIANVLGYLSRTGKLRRVERGHYVVIEGPAIGAGVVTDDEVTGSDYGQRRLTEHDF